MANPAHLAVLDQGVQVWNEWRTLPEAGQPSLFCADLRGRDLSGANLRGADLSECDFSGSKLRDADLRDVVAEATGFAGADLQGTQWQGARIPGADFAAVRLDGVDLQRTPLNRKQWVQAGITVTCTAQGQLLDRLHQGAAVWNAWRRQSPHDEVNLAGAMLAGIDLRGGVDLRGANLRYADLSSANLHNAQLSLADLSGATLDGAGLREANLVGALLNGASLQSADLSDANLVGANGARADFRGAKLRGANLMDMRGEAPYFFCGNRAHLDRLCQGTPAWNEWRQANLETVPDLCGADLTSLDLGDADLRQTLLRGVQLFQASIKGARLTGADLRDANLTDAFLDSADLQGACLSGAHLQSALLAGANLRACDFSFCDLREARLPGAQAEGARFSGANMTGAMLLQSDLRDADLMFARLSNATLMEARLSGALLEGAMMNSADLRSADLQGANLLRADLSNADLCGANLCDASLVDADLQMAMLVNTRLDGAVMTGCRVFGVSAWKLDLARVKDQSNLIITQHDEPAITVDNLEVAQFIYLMLHNQKIRDVIDTVTGKGVLLLGRFTGERKAVLDGLRERLRQLNFVPMVFDWDPSASRDLTETVQLLASMSRFVVADVTDAKSIPQELMSIVPHMPSVPVRPIVLSGQNVYAMFEHFKPYPWMLPVYAYDDQAQLLADVDRAVIAPVLAWEAQRKNKPDLEAQLRAQQDEIAQLRAALLARPATG